MLDFILIFLGIVLLFKWYNGKPKNYPPGPPCLPFVGSTPFVQTQNFHLYLENIREKYGTVVGFKFGPSHVIGVGGVREVKEVLSRGEFQGRTKFLDLDQGIMFSEGDFWAAQRKFTVKHLRDFGFGKRTVEQVVLQEADEFFEKVLRKAETIQVSGLFSVSTINVLWNMIGGERYSHDDDDFKYLLRSIQKRFRAGNLTGGLLNAYPLLRKLLANFEPFKEEQRSQDLLTKFLQKAIDSHKKTKSNEPRDFIDMYLRELEVAERHPSFSEVTLRSVCIDLFSAGVESVANSLGFCLLYCILYPEWQDQMYEEISKYDATLTYLNHAGRLSKVEAFLSEVTRCNTIASITVPHKAVRDTELNGYFIPKDSTLLVSLWSVLQDEQLWKDPKNFRPDRFLDENGKYTPHVGWLPAFGAGKRICPGEGFSKKMTFVYFIALIREFKFSIPEGHPKPSTVCMPGFTNAPQPFSVKIVKR